MKLRGSLVILALGLLFAWKAQDWREPEMPERLSVPDYVSGLAPIYLNGQYSSRCSFSISPYNCAFAELKARAKGKEVGTATWQHISGEPSEKPCGATPPDETHWPARTDGLCYAEDAK